MPHPETKLAGTHGHLTPAGVDHHRFRTDRERLLALLQAEGLDVRLYDSAFNPYPFAVTPEHLAGLCALQRCIHRAIVAVVTHFTKDERLSTVIQLPAKEQD